MVKIYIDNFPHRFPAEKRDVRAVLWCRCGARGEVRAKRRSGASARDNYTTGRPMARLREAQERRERPRQLYHGTSNGAAVRSTGAAWAPAHQLYHETSNGAAARSAGAAQAAAGLPEANADLDNYTTK